MRFDRTSAVHNIIISNSRIDILSRKQKYSIHRVSNYIKYGGLCMFDHLFSPITIRGMELKSRAIMPAWVQSFQGTQAL